MDWLTCPRCHRSGSSAISSKKSFSQTRREHSRLLFWRQSSFTTTTAISVRQTITSTTQLPNIILQPGALQPLAQQKQQHNFRLPCTLTLSLLRCSEIEYNFFVASDILFGTSSTSMIAGMVRQIVSRSWRGSLSFTGLRPQRQEAL